MSYPYGPPPPWGPPPPLHHPPPPHHYPPYPPPHPHYLPPPYQPPPHDGGALTAPGPAPSPYPYYVQGTMMVPVPIATMPTPAPTPSEDQGPSTTYITNYIYHGDTTVQENSVDVVESSGEFDWVPTTAMMANSLTGRAVVGGHEGWDGSPLWVIRSWHNGDLIPGKLSVRHNAASIVYNGKEVSVQNIEVLCAKPESLRWVPASNGNVPPGAIPGGRTSTGTGGETLYIGRARYQLSVTPGKVHPSHQSCYIAFAGTEVAHKMYDVLCRIS